MPTARVVEFRIFRIHHGRRDEFIARFRDHLLPLLRNHGIETVAWGPSLHDQDSFYLVRAYPSVEARQIALDAMFGSAEWLAEQEDVVLGMIESYNTFVVETGEPLIAAMAEGLAGVATVEKLAEQDGSDERS
jgi:hypothetical protein